METQTKEQEAIEGNKLIAEFMNVHFHATGTVGSYPAILPMEMGITNEDSLKFHSDWSWLMPVVEKIESLFDNPCYQFWVYISGNTCLIEDESEDEPIFDLTGHSKIEATWLAIIKFIQWYNSQKK